MTPKKRSGVVGLLFLIKCYRMYSDAAHRMLELASLVKPSCFVMHSWDSVWEHYTLVLNATGIRIRMRQAGVGEEGGRHIFK